MGNSSALLINILLGSFQLFLHSDQPGSEIIPFSGVCQSGGGCIIHAGGGGGYHALTDRLLLWCANWRRPAATSSRRASFSALASANSFVYFASSAATSRWRICNVSNCRVRQLQFSGIFVALGFVGNGVITVMINSPWQQTMMQITRAEIIAVTLLIHQSLTVPPASLNFAIRLSALCSNWP